MSEQKMSIDQLRRHEKTVQEQRELNKAENKVQYNFETSKLYYREPYTLQCILPNKKTGEKFVTGEITIHQPTVGDILDCGETAFVTSAKVFTTNTTENRLMLWNQEINWNKMKDFDLFTMFLKAGMVRPEIEKMFFGGFSFSSLRRFEGNDEAFLIDPNTNLCITEETYFELREYMRTMLHWFPKEEFAKGKYTQRAIIFGDEADLRAVQKKRVGNSYYLPLISFYECEFGVTEDYIRNLGIYRFMYNIKRMQIIEKARAVLRGMYSALVFDSSKARPDDYDMLQAI